jgi:flagellar biosynthetic protein FliP
MTDTTLSPNRSTTSGRTRGRIRAMARHYAEMVVAMFAGMILLGGLRDLVGLTVPFADRPGLSYVLMATDMAIGMAAWMTIRRHDSASTLEMCAAMYVPVVLLPLVWAGAMAPMTFMLVAHVLMLVAMLAVLLRHRHHYAHC